MFRMWRASLGLVGVACVVFAGTVRAEEQSGGEVEEVVVTGSFIKGTPEDAALPVDVTTAEDLEKVGTPTVVEMVRNLAYTSGNIAESNQFATSGGSSQGREGTVNINLRGLGGARTLVLINGHRQVPQSAQGVDLGLLPVSAIGRLEVLKDGAAALYGSDAIGGVVNFITREGYEGIEIGASEQFIDESSGDHNASAIAGWASDNANAFVAVEWLHNSELNFMDRDWGLVPYPDNPNGGWTGTGNPATYYRTTATGTIVTAANADPQCNVLGGYITGVTATDPLGTSCQFQFTRYDNITEEQDHYKAYTEFNVDLSDTTRWHTEVAWSMMKMPEEKSSPSYGPVQLTGRARLVTPDHPGLVAMRAQYPQYFGTDVTLPDGTVLPAASLGAISLFRIAGVSGWRGDGGTIDYTNETLRIGTGLDGTLFDALDYDVGVTYSRFERKLGHILDTLQERSALALDGFGGPDCVLNVANRGIGNCMFYNPFSNAIEYSVTNGVTNPDFNPAVANSTELMEWMQEELESDTQTQLLVWDAVFSGETPLALSGGNVGWAAGFQARNEKYRVDVNDATDLEKNPCPFNLQFSVDRGYITQQAFNDCQNGVSAATGIFGFLSGTYEENLSRNVYGLFAELALPISDTVDAQLAVRYEDYGGEVGSTVDPKFAASWQMLDWLKFRGSVSTTFRGPPQQSLTGRGTALQFINAAGSYKAVDIVGNPNLKPETALNTNVGVIIETGGLYMSVDYWRFDFEDPFQTEAANPIVSRYLALGCQDGGAGVSTDDCQALRAHIFPTGTTAAGIARVETNIINGADIVTSGIDSYVQYTFEGVFDGELTVGAQGSYTIEYDSKDFTDINGVFLGAGGDFVGYLNNATAPFTPLPDFKGDGFVKYDRDIHSATLVARYTNGYHDANPNTPLALRNIEDQITYDAHYVLSLFEGNATVSLSAINFLDEDPPFVSVGPNYDPFTHDPRGRVLKLGLKYAFFQQ